jgi:hypothetical protein
LAAATSPAPAPAARIPPAIARQPNKARPIKPRSFTGKEKFETWARALRTFLELQGIEDEREKLFNGGAMLDGEAAGRFTILGEARAERGEDELADTGGFATLDEMLENFKKYYAPPDRQRQAEVDLARLRQMGNVRDYYDRLRDAAVRRGNVNDEEMQRLFAQGLKPWLYREASKQFHHYNKPPTLEEMFQAALSIERSSESQAYRVGGARYWRPGRSGGPGRSGEPSSSRSAKPPPYAKKHTASAMSARQKGKPKKPPVNDHPHAVPLLKQDGSYIECWECGENHRKRDCPKLKGGRRHASEPPAALRPEN